MKATAIKNNIENEVNKAFNVIKIDTNEAKNISRFIFDKNFETDNVSTQEILEMLDSISEEVDKVKMLIGLLN